MEKEQSAVILCDPEVGSIRIAALSLLDRLVVTIFRSGCNSIKIVSEEAIPSLKRAKKWGIKPIVVRRVPSIKTPTLIATCSLLVQVPDVKKIVKANGRLVNQRGESLLIGLVSDYSGNLEESLKDLKPVTAFGVAESVCDSFTARRAEQALWDAAYSETDGFVDKHLNRPLGRFLSKILIHTPITPNQITIFSTLIGLLAAYCFGRGTYAGGIAGALLFQLSALMDCVDGEIARMLYKESRFGKWLDICSDQIVHIALFAAIAIGLARSETDVPVLILAISAVVGTLISFAVIIRGMLRSRESVHKRFQKFIDATANRDFSVLLILFSLTQKLDWFLWLAGVGVHLFWITALILQTFKTEPLSSTKHRGL